MGIESAMTDIIDPGRHAAGDPLLQRLEQLESTGELEHRGALAAGDDQAGQPRELLLRADLDGVRAGDAGQQRHVLAEAALQREHAERGLCSGAHGALTGVDPLAAHVEAPPELARRLAQAQEGERPLHRLLQGEEGQEDAGNGEGQQGHAQVGGHVKGHDLRGLEAESAGGSAAKGEHEEAGMGDGGVSEEALEI